jgi:hypothetical protein
VVRAIAEANDFDRFDDQLPRGVGFGHDLNIISQGLLMFRPCVES